MQWLIIWLLVMVLVTVIGHGIWMLVAALWRAATGSQPRPAPPHRTQSPQQIAQRDLIGFKNTVDRLGQQGQLTPEQLAQLHRLGQAQAEHLFGSPASATPSVATPSAATPPGSSTAVPFTESPARAESPAGADSPVGADSPAAGDGCRYESGVHPLDRVEPPAAEHLRSPAAAASGPRRPASPPAMRRAASEVLASFLVAHNIRWGELVAGLLIVFCSIGLVISLWNPLTETHRLLPSLVFLLGTIGIEAAGLYTLSRWRLRHTSRAVLTIATLLIPLSVVAGIAVAGSGPDAVRLDDPSVLAVVAVGALLYGGAIWLSGRALVGRHNAPWWLLGIGAPTLCLPAVPFVLRNFGSAGSWLAGLAAAAAAVGITVAVGRRAGRSGNRARTWPVAGRNQLLLTAICGYAVAVTVGFLLFPQPKRAVTIVPLVVSLMPLWIALAGAGSVLRRTRVSWLRVGGTALVLGGLSAGIAALPLAAMRPQWLALWAGWTLVASLVVGWRLRSGPVLAAGTVAVGVPVMLLAPWWLAEEPWGGGHQILLRCLGPHSLLLCFAYATLLWVTAVALTFRRRMGEHANAPVQSAVTGGAGWWLVVAAVLAAVRQAGQELLELEPAWKASAAVLLGVGTAAILSSMLLKQRRRHVEPLFYRRRWTLLAAGQIALLAAGIVGLRWHVPLPIPRSVDLSIDSLRDLVAAPSLWWYLGWFGCFALAWSAVRALVPKRFPGNLSDRPRRWSPDVVAGLIAVAGVILMTAATLAWLLWQTPAAWASRSAWVVPLVVITLTSVWSWAYRSGRETLRDALREARALLVQAAILCLALAACMGRDDAWLWIGSIVLGGALLTLTAVVGAGRRADRAGRLGPTGRVTVASWTKATAAWSGAVMLAIAAVVLYRHLWQPVLDSAPIAVRSALVVAVWWGVVSIALAVGALATARQRYGWLAVIAMLVAAVLAALVLTGTFWNGLQVVGWITLIAVLGQRTSHAVGLERRLAQLVSWSRHEGELPAWQPTGLVSWTPPSLGLAAVSLAVAVAISSAAAMTVWDASWTAHPPHATGALALAGTVVVLTAWLSRARWPLSLSLPTLAILLAGPSGAAAIAWGVLSPAQGPLWIVGTVVALAGVDAVLAKLGDPRGICWSAGLIKATTVVALALSARWTLGWGLGFAVAACLLIQALALLSAQRAGTDWLHGRRPAASWRVRWVIAQILWCGGLAAGSLFLLDLARTAGFPPPPRWSWVLIGLALSAAATRVGLNRTLASFAAWGEWTALSGGALVAVGIMLLRLDGGFDTATGFGAAWLPSGTVVLAAGLMVVTTLRRVGARGHVVHATAMWLLVFGTVAYEIGAAYEGGNLFGIVTATAACGLVLATWLWPLRRRVNSPLPASLTYWDAADDRRATGELSLAAIATSVLFMALALAGVAWWIEPLSRYLLIASVMLGAWGIASVADQGDASRLRTAAVWVLTAALLLLAIAPPDAHDLRADAHHLRALISSMQMLVAGCVLVPLYGWLIPRSFGRSNAAWQPALRQGAGLGAAVAAVSLGAMFVLEAMARQDGQIAGLDRPLVFGVAGLLAAMCGVVTWVVVRSGRTDRSSILPALDTGQRVTLIYVAQALGLLTWLHLYLCDRSLALLGMRPYWPYIVMLLAFLSVGVIHWARRRGDMVLADTLRGSALLLPLVPAIGFWLSSGASDWHFVGGRVGYATALLEAAIYYVGVSVLWREDRWPRLLAVLAGNATIWVALAQMPGWGVLAHPQLWLIPPAVCVLAAVHLERGRLPASVVAAMRYAALATIYLSSTADMLLQEVGQTLWGPILLLTMALAGVAAGVLLQVRSFLYMGTFFVLVGVLSMVWHAQAALDNVWPWWAFGITSGVLILIALTMIEKQKAKIRRLSERLGAWEG